MRSDLRISSTLRVKPPFPERWLRGLLGRPADTPQFSVKIPDLELRRGGHISAGSPDAVQVREEFRAIKKHVLAHIQEGVGAGGRSARIVLVTSSLSGEGKTFVALNLALSLAINREVAVTLIDGDVVSQGLTRKLNLTADGGLLDALDRGASDAAGIVQDTNIGNLGIIAAGRPRSDAAELLSGSRMSSLLDQLTNRSPGQIVILDSASILSGSSASVLAAHAGQTVFVIGCSETGRSTVDEALTILDGNIGPLESANIGLVLNKINPAQSAARYSANST